VSADSVDAPAPITRPWVAAGAKVRLAWSPGDPVVVGVDVGAAVPVLRDEFRVDPAISLFRAPPVVAAGGAWLGVRFL
jgi:hypothetical protein